MNLFRSRPLNVAYQQQNLSVRTAKRAFRGCGWKIDGFQTDRISFFLQPGWIGVCISDRVTDLLFTDIMELRDQGYRKIAVVTNSEVSKLVEDSARARQIPILKWPHIDRLLEQLDKAEQLGSLALADAKMNPRTLPPISTVSLSRPLSDAEKLKGFFFATQNVSCWFKPGNARKLLITFSHTASDPESGERRGELNGTGVKYACLGFETSALNWFPVDDMEQCIQAVHEILGARFQVRLLFGAGQGGYAALRYSKQLGATMILAFSPQFSIDTQILSDERFSNFYKSSLHSGMAIKSEHVAGRAFVAYDPMDINEVRHVKRISAQVSVEHIALPYAGHLCSHVLYAPGGVAGMLRAGEQVNSASMKISALMWRQKNPQRAFLMALHLATRKPQIAYSIFVKYRGIQPHMGWGHVCFRLAESGFGDKVYEWVAAHADANLSNPEAQEHAALLSLKVSKFAEAVKYIQRSIELDPLNHRYKDIRMNILENHF